MRIARAEVHETGGPLEAAVRNARTRWTERRGLTLRLEDEDGQVGLGEAAPLPGYSSDTLEQARETLETFARTVSEHPVAWHEDAPLLAATEALGLAPRAGPAARFAIETAVLDLIGRRDGTPVHRWLGAEPAGVDLALLVDGEDPAATARRARDGGFRCLKVKLGGDPVSDIDVLRAVRREVGPEVSLRLDANGSVEPSRADGWLQAIAGLDVELVEEPVPFEALMRIAPPAVPIALDESLQGPEGAERLAQALAAGRCQAVVLKPMALGGLSRCLELARIARDGGARVVVSHLLDGPIALAACAELALALEHELAAGLAPHAGLTAFEPRHIAALRGSRLEPHGEPGLGLSRIEAEASAAGAHP